MPNSPWTTDERAWLKSHVPAWLLVRDDPHSDRRVDGISPTDAFFQTLINDFLFEFPSRVWARPGDQGHETGASWTAFMRKKFHQFLNNKGRKLKVAKVKAPEFARFTTGRQLAMRDLNGAIREKAAEMQAEYSVIDTRTVWNMATTAVMKKMEKDNPEVIQKIYDKAAAIRTAASRDAVEQDRDVLIQLRRLFPKRIYNTAHEWGRTTGASIYIAAVYDTPDRGVMFIDACSENIQDFLASDHTAQFQATFTEYVCGVKGGPEKVPTPCAYPDRTNQYRPLVPGVDVVNLHDTKLVQGIIRDVVNQTWKHFGGEGQTPWKAIAEDCHNRRYTFVERTRMPVWLLQDPKLMSVMELRAWYTHIVESQEGRIPPKQRFQFAMTTKHDRSIVVARYPTFCNQRHRDADVRWSSEQLAFAQYMESRPQPGRSMISWHGLPVARSVSCYVPFTPQEESILRAAAPNQVDISSLVDLAISVETLGPAHLQSTPQGALNAHLPSNLYTGSLLALLQKPWPAIAFFNEELDDHSTYAMTTLLYWIKATPCFRHQESGSLLCGPAGIRWLVALLAFIAQSLLKLDRRQDVPPPIAEAFHERAQSFRWTTLRSAISYVRAELESTHRMLSQTFPDRNQVWKTQLQAVYETGSNRPAHISTPVTQCSHYAVPIDQRQLQQCYDEVMQPINNGTQPVPPSNAPLVQRSANVPQTSTTISRDRPASNRVVRIVPPEMSAEYIDLPDFGPDTTDDDEDNDIIDHARDADDGENDHFSNLVEQSFGLERLNPNYKPSDPDEDTSPPAQPILPQDLIVPARKASTSTIVGAPAMSNNPSSVLKVVPSPSPFVPSESKEITTSYHPMAKPANKTGVQPGSSHCPKQPDIDNTPTPPPASLVQLSTVSPPTPHPSMTTSETASAVAGPYTPLQTDQGTSTQVATTRTRPHRSTAVRNARVEEAIKSSRKGRKSSGGT
ncbi:hypothetical protein FRC12_020322 [Ceratobasidium sp. 428]|nr:hypothetical protein FRC12_020322 [Ceratobasidium sp. 428]